MTTPIKYRISSTATKPVSDTVKGAPLTSLEIDGNFRSIKDSIELIQSAYLPAGYSAPVDYVAGVILSSAAQTVAYQGEVYAPVAAEVPFTTSGTFEVTKFVQIQSVASVDLAASSGSSLVGYMPSGAGAVAATVQSKLRELDAESNFNSNNGFIGLIKVASSAMILGDSITEAAGASSYTNGYAYQVARSIINARDNGFQKDPGFGWHSDINQANAINTGLTSTGSISSTGLVDNRRSLAEGQSITITGRAFNSVYVIYDGATSAGSLVIARNGSTLSTQAVSGTTIGNTASVTNTWAENDSLTITASGGTVIVCGVLTIKTAQSANLLYVAGKSGYAYQDYTTTAALDEIAYWLNLFRSGNEKLLILNLGTNNLYNAGKTKTPDAMVAEISALINGVNARCSNVKYIVSVPPKANESIFPIRASGYVYADYVNAIVDFARSNGHGLLRHDQSILSRSNDYYSDGVHPNNFGHRVMAQTVCEALGIVLDPYVRTTVPTELSVEVAAQLAGSQAEIVMNGTWGPFTGSSSLRAKSHLLGNTVVLSGIVAPNGSASTTIGTLPAGYRPSGRTCYLIGRSDAGAVPLSIAPEGVIVLAAVPSSWFSLEGITFAVTRT